MTQKKKADIILTLGIFSILLMIFFVILNIVNGSIVVAMIVTPFVIAVIRQLARFYKYQWSNLEGEMEDE